MLRKLFKYDFKSVNKDLIPLYISCIILSYVVIMCANNSNDAIVAAKKVCTDLSLVGMFFIIILPFSKVYLKIRNNLFREESYLFLTLPIKRSNLYDSKVLVSILSLVISWIILGICFINVFSGKNVFSFVSGLLDNYTGIESNFIFIITIAVQFSLIFMSLITGLIFGNKMDKGKDLLSFVFGVLIYLIIRLAIGYFYDLDNNIISIGIVLFADILLYILGRYIYNKGVNVL